MNKKMITILLTCIGLAHAYNFDGTYTGNGKSIETIIINKSKVSLVSKCSSGRCKWTGAAVKSLRINDGNTLVLELAPLNNNGVSFYPTLVLTPTRDSQSIQAVMISYRSYSKGAIAESDDPGYGSYSEILTRK